MKNGNYGTKVIVMLTKIPNHYIDVKFLWMLMTEHFTSRHIKKKEKHWITKDIMCKNIDLETILTFPLIFD